MVPDGSVPTTVLNTRSFASVKSVSNQHTSVHHGQHDLHSLHIPHMRTAADRQPGTEVPRQEQRAQETSFLLGGAQFYLSVSFY